MKKEIKTTLLSHFLILNATKNLVFQKNFEKSEIETIKFLNEK